MERVSSKHQEDEASRIFLTPPSIQEIRAILAAAGTDPKLGDLQDVVSILLYTGMRCGELRELRWSDINFEDKSITIIAGKTVRTRSIPVADWLIEVLRERRQRLPDQECVLGTSPRRVLDRVAHQFRIVSTRTLGRTFNLHSLRHTFAWLWADWGGNPVVLAYVMGYRSVLTTFRSFASPRQHFKLAASELAKIEGHVNHSVSFEYRSDLP